MPNDLRAASNPWRRERLVIGMLVASVFVNYIDRGNLGLAAPLLTKDLAINATQMGALLGAFSWTYALLQLFGISGWLADNLPVGYVLLVGYFLWTAATTATGLLSGFTAIFATRLVLGIGESVAYPCYSRVFASLPQDHRGRANAFIDAGTKLGPSLGVLAGGLLMQHYGWRGLFLVLGLGGFLWIVPWVFLMPRERVILASGAAQASAWKILTLRSAWGTFLGHFCGNYFYYYLMAWLPTYLVREAHMTTLGMSRFTSLAFLLIASTTVFTGWLSDHLIARGISPTLVRKTLVASGLLLASMVALVAIVPGTSTAALVLVLAACMGFGAYASNHWAISQTLAGPSMAGRWTGLQNGIANLSGILGPWVSGMIAERSGSLRIAFGVTGIFALLGSLCWALIVQHVEPVNWSQETVADISD